MITVGKNSSITRINARLKDFTVRTSPSIEERQEILMALAKDVWRTEPVTVQTGS